MGNLVKSISNGLNTNTDLNQLKTFYEVIKSDVGTGKRSFQIAIEEVESNIAWRERSYTILEEWLSKELSSDANNKL